MLESPINPDKRCMLRLTFNSLQDTLNKGCVLGNVGIKDGFLDFKATSGGTVDVYNILFAPAKQYSFRVKMTKFVNLNTPMYLLINKGFNIAIYILADNTVGLGGGTSLLVYQDGILRSNGKIVPTDKPTELVFTFTNTSICSPYLRFFAAVNGFGQLQDSNGGKIDLVEIYQGTLTADEVSLLYSNSLYRPFNDKSEILHMHSKHIGDKYGVQATYTNCSIENDGFKCNLNAGKITLADTSKYIMTDGVNDIPFSISFWARPAFMPGEYIIPFSLTGSYIGYDSAFGRTSREFSFVVRGPNNGAYIQTSVSTAIIKNKWNFISIAYDGLKNANSITIRTWNSIDGWKSSSAGSNVGYTGMQVVNNTLNLFSRNDTIYTRSTIESFRMFKNKVLTNKEFTQIMNSERVLYNLQ